MKECLSTQKNSIGYIKMKENNILLVCWEQDQGGFIVFDMLFMNEYEAQKYEPRHQMTTSFKCLIPEQQFNEFIDSLDTYEFHHLMYELVCYCEYNEDTTIFHDEFHPVMVGLECN